MSRRHTVVLAFLLALFAARLADTARKKSFTFDEPHYVGTGLYLWETGDYQWLNVLSGQAPLAFHLAALPLLAVDLHDVRPTPDLGFRLLAGDPARVARIRFLSRLPFVALACWGAWLLFAWGREAAGPVAGLVAVFCYTFCPTILANAALAHSDVVVTVLFLQTLYCLWRWWARPTHLRLVLAGVSLGLALAAKLSAVLLLPPIALVVAAAAVTGRPATGEGPWALPAGPGPRLRWAAGVGGVLVALGVLVVWAAYGGSFATTAAANEPDWGWPMPGYFRAFWFDHKANELGRRVYLLGEIAERGWWYFFPVAFAVKTPLALLLLLALAATVRAGAARPAGPPLAPFVAVPLAFYVLVACFVLKVPLGIRYLLPVYPLLWLLVGVQAARARGAVRRVVAVAAGAWLAVASLAVHPDYLAYFNEAAGGARNGRRWLIESNLDWGQDLRALAGWLRSRGNPPVRLAYFGRETPGLYLLNVAGVPGCTPVGGLVAISVNVLEGLYPPQGQLLPPPPGCYDWLKRQTPVAAPGGSILVYDSKA